MSLLQNFWITACPVFNHCRIIIFWTQTLYIQFHVYKIRLNQPNKPNKQIRNAMFQTNLWTASLTELWHTYVLKFSLNVTWDTVVGLFINNTLTGQHLTSSRSRVKMFILVSETLYPNLVFKLKCSPIIKTHRTEERTAARHGSITWQSISRNIYYAYGTVFS